ncbi:MAG: asparaginase [Pseudomonadota bacterium]
MAPSETVPPVLVEVRRGAALESRHRGAVAVVDSVGRLIEAHGDIDRPVYPRSAIKPLQALALIETGAAAAFAVSEPELAIACASHAGEPAHVAAVAAWLQRLGLAPEDLECGAHLPYHAASAHALIRAGQAPTALHNNCSGKHTGILATCRHLGEATRGYMAPDHPAQLRVARVIEEMCGVDLAAAPRGVDGCGLPQFAIPLRSLALGFARLASPDALARARAASCRAISRAMTAHPFMLAGTGRFCTRVAEIARGLALVKTGAEGMYLAAVPGRGLGLALKIEDGAARAAEVALAALLARLAGFDEGQRAALRPLIEPPLTNVSGVAVGVLSPARVLDAR